MRTVSIVTALYNEESGVYPLLSEIDDALSGLTNYRFCVYVVDDGSTDSTLNKLKTFVPRSFELSIIKLSRNFGHQNAFSAGLNSISDSSDALIFMDGDLEDPPSLIPKMIEKWEEGYKTVNAVKRSRNESFLRKTFFSLFHLLITKVSNISIDKNAGMFSLMDKRVYSELQRLNEQNLYLVGLRYFLGFSATKIEYDRESRRSGESKQSLFRLFKYAMDAFFAFSDLPIRVLSVLGWGVMAISLSLSLVYASVRIFNISWWILQPLPGWTTIIFFNTFILGAVLVFLGVTCSYVSRTLDETRKRPLYVIEEISKSKEAVAWKENQPEIGFY